MKNNSVQLLTKEEIKKLVIEQGLTITQLIDVVIEMNGIIGVGLISLGQDLNNYCIGIRTPETETTPETVTVEKDILISLNYNKYKGTGKCWIAEIDPRTKEKLGFLDAKSVEKRDSYSGDKNFLVPLIEGKAYQFRESGSKTNDSNYYRIVKNNELVEL